MESNEKPPVDKSKAPHSSRKIPTQLPTIKDLEFGEILGSGFFSHVYAGKYRGENVAIKIIERGSKTHILREIEILKKLKKIDCIVKMKAAYQYDNVILVFEHIPGISRSEFFENLTAGTLRKTIKQVFLGLKEVKKHKIVHRDMKLDNILITPNFKKIVLIDWGCSAYVTNEMNPQAGSRISRSPDMLLGYNGYGYACDMWAIGVMLVDILTEGNIPWKTETADESIVRLAEIFGGRKLFSIALKYDLHIPIEIARQLPKRPTRKLTDYFTPIGKQLYTEKLENLMEKLLDLDPQKRITVDQALKHKYFYTTDNSEKQLEKIKQKRRSDKNRRRSVQREPIRRNSVEQIISNHIEKTPSKHIETVVSNHVEHPNKDNSYSTKYEYDSTPQSGIGISPEKAQPSPLNIMDQPSNQLYKEDDTPSMISSDHTINIENDRSYSDIQRIESGKNGSDIVVKIPTLSRRSRLSFITPETRRSTDDPLTKSKIVPDDDIDRRRSRNESPGDEGNHGRKLSTREDKKASKILPKPKSSLRRHSHSKKH